MDETNNFLNLLDSKFHHKFALLEENSEKELNDLNILKDSLFQISGIKI